MLKKEKLPNSKNNPEHTDSEDFNSNKEARQEMGKDVYKIRQMILNGQATFELKINPKTHRQEFFAYNLIDNKNPVFFSDIEMVISLILDGI